MTHHVTATFKTRSEAEAVVQKLLAHGFTQNNISMLVTDSTRGLSFDMKEENKAGDYASTGAGAGGAVGALAALLMAASVIPTGGLSLVAIGPIAATLAGLGAGGLAGGIIGAMVGMGVPEHEAKLYESSIKSGGILLAVTAMDSEEKQKAQDIMKNGESVRAAA